LVVDGGRGQLGIAQAVLTELELSDLPIAALAKEKPNALGAELVDRVYTPGRLNPVEVRSAMSSLGILAQARDEAHRVSNALRIRLGKGQRLRTQLDDVPFVGKKTRIALLKKLGSMEAVSAASVEQLQAAGATLRQARAIVDHLSRAVPTAEGSEEDALENAFDAGDPAVESEGSDQPLAAAVEFDVLATDAEGPSAEAGPEPPAAVSATAASEADAPPHDATH
jgi:excinuclease ABC subunit C